MYRLRVRFLIPIAIVLSCAGGMAYVRFYELRGDHDPNFLYLLALGIGTALGLLADQRRHRIVVVLIAAASSVGAGIVGNLEITILQSSAAAAEYNPAELENPDFFVALEAYKLRYADEKVAPPFMGVAERKRLSDEEWAEGKARWESMSESDRNAIQTEWQTAYEYLGGGREIRLVFTAPWNLYAYSISAAIASGIVVMFQIEQRKRRPAD